MLSERTHHRKPNTLHIRSFDTPRGVRFIETECSKTSYHGLGAGRNGELFNATEFPLGMLKKFWRQLEASVAQQCK